MVNDVQTMAERLDEVAPGWANRVQVRNLDMESARYCVLAQAFRQRQPFQPGWFSGGFSVGYARLGMPSTKVFFDNRFRAEWVGAIQARQTPLPSWWSRFVTRATALFRRPAVA